MYKCKSKILAALLTIVLVFSIFPSLRVNAAVVASGECGAQGDNLTWTFDDAGVLTISGKGDMKDFPSFNGMPWYQYREGILEVILSDGVTSIGEWAFYDCNYLTKISIPDSVSFIGEYAFTGCGRLEEITIPDKVTSIGDATFDGCFRLTEITIPDSVTSIGDYAFAQCSFTNITIPDKVTSIGSFAFFNCPYLTDITIPDNVTSIGEYAFSQCPSLISINIPDSVTSIDERTFNYCTNLQSINIPDSVLSIGEGAFTFCSNLQSINIPDSVLSVGEYAFANCTNLTDVSMSKKLYENIDLEKVFFGISTLPNIHISYAINYKNNGNGTISGTTTESFGTDQIELTIQPDSNFELDKIEWSDGTNTVELKETNGKYTMPESEAGAVTVTATFKRVKADVTFVSDDGKTVLQTTNYDLNAVPSYTGTTPAKAEDDKYTYTFAGWSDGTKTYGPTDTLPAVTDDATYTAVFDSTVKQYTIKFVDEDGSVLQSGDFDFGSTPAYTGTTPTKAEDDDYTYTFAGWTPAIVSVTGNTTYTATFTKTAKSTEPEEPTTPTKPAPVTKPGTYYLSSMEEQDGKLVITIKMNEDDSKTFDLLGSISSDGVLLTEGNQYARAKGSLIITLQKSFLDTLAAGNHKLTVTFTDGGSITIDYVVKAPATASVPATGEAISAASILGCIILATAGIAFTVSRKRKEEI